VLDIREGAETAAFLFREVRADIRAAFSIDKRGLARHWRQYACEFIGYMASVVVGLVVLSVIFGVGD
jgi:hypothetical protein